MKKLVLVLSVVFVTMSSFLVLEKEVLPTGCFSECDDRASGNASQYGWTYQEEFDFFSDCYFTYCSGGGDGQVQFPGGNTY